MAALVVFLVGVIIWGIFGHIDSTVSSVVRVENGSAVCYVSEDDFYSVDQGMSVKFGSFEAVISEIGQKEEFGYVCTLISEQEIPDGVYEGKIVTNSIKPLSFILN